MTLPNFCTPACQVSPAPRVDASFSTILVFLLLTVLTSCSAPIEKAPTAAENWAIALGPGSNHASTLSQIQPDNVSSLQIAWTYRSGDAGKHTQIQCNPLIISGKVYATSPGLDVVCLNAATGEEIWRSQPWKNIPAGEIPSPGMGVNRGVVYAASGTGDRIFVSVGPYLYALAATDGSFISTFGDGGKIDLRKGLRAGAEKTFVIANSPGVVYDNKIIIGCRVAEESGAAPGHIRAYDIHTGEMKWIFHTIPHPGEPGYDTWPEEGYLRNGGANAWAGLTLDADRGLVFVPTGSASYDFYGADRLGSNLYANCLLALDAATGELKWHFQAVHHDLWDRDLPAAPNLVTITRDGKTLPAVAQITKTGHVYVFHRETGEALFPIEELEVPSSDMPGESSWPTQPLPSSPPPFSRQRVTGIHSHSKDKDSLEKVLAGLRQRGIFEPPSREGTLIFPGYDGGGEWGGAAFSPWDEYLVVNSSQMAWSLHMIPSKSDHPGREVYLTTCSSCHGADRAGGEFMGKIPSLVGIGERLSEAALRQILIQGKGSMPSFASLPATDQDAVTKYLLDIPMSGAESMSSSSGSAYVSSGYRRFLDSEGYPAIHPPWGLLTAIDLAKGTIAWEVPLGEYPELTARGIAPTGTENYGGPLVTAAGITFIAATRDEKIRAFRTLTGELLWEADLPAGGYATPSTYSVDGKQYLIIACGGGKMGTPSGDSYVAFALP